MHFNIQFQMNEMVLRFVYDWEIRTRRTEKKNEKEEDRKRWINMFTPDPIAFESALWKLNESSDDYIKDKQNEERGKK